MILGIALEAPSNALAAGDSVAPALVSFAISPSSVDSSAAPRTVTVTARITDAGSGVAVCCSSAYFSSPSGQNVWASFAASDRISGDAQDGIYQSDMTIAEQSGSGTWLVGFVQLQDEVGNTRSFDASELQDAGFPNSFEQTGSGDSVAPALVSFAISPSSVDSSAAPRTVTVTARITDAGSGVAVCCSSAYFSSPSGQNVWASFAASDRISGDAQDGIYQSDMTIAEQSGSGTWLVGFVQLQDEVGNTRSFDASELQDAGFPNSFEQTGSGDSVAPALVSFAISPSSVDSSAAPRTVTVTARITDAGSGVAVCCSSAYFSSPSGQNVWASFAASDRISGDAQDGIYQSDMTIAEQSGSGTWLVGFVQLQDEVGNTRSFDASELQDAGFPNSFENGTADTTAPQTTIDSGPSGSVNQTTADFGFSSSETGSSFECELDGDGFTACSSPEGFTDLADGAHTFSVRATDAADNTDSTPATRTWTVDPSEPADTTAPQTTIDSGPSGSVNQTTADFGFSSSETGSSFECELDGDGFTACSSPEGFTDLADGAHTFSVRATDAADNTDSTPATRTWTVDPSEPADTTAPQTTIDSGPSGSVNQTTADFGFSSSETGSSFECELDGDGFTACSSPEGFTDLADGAHTFSVRATDAADNTDSTPATRTWTVDPSEPADTTAPQTTIDSGPSGSVNQTTADFGFSSSETGSSFACKLDGGPWASCSSPDRRSNLADGDHTFKVLATDAADNTDPTTATQTWTVDTSDPQTTIDSGPSGTVNQQAATFTFSSADAGSTYQCKLDGGTWAACSSPETRTNLSDGDHTFKVLATDAADNTDLTAATRTWTVDTNAPPTTNAPPAALTPLPPAIAVPVNAPDVIGPAAVSCSPKTTLRPTSRGIVTFRCGSFTEPITGTLVLSTATKVRYKGKTRVIAIGSKRFAAPVGPKVVIKIKITKQGRQALRQLRKLRVKLTLTARDTANNATVKKSVITLKK